MGAHPPEGAGERTCTVSSNSSAVTSLLQGAFRSDLATCAALPSGTITNAMDNANEHVTTNREYWNGKAHGWVAAGERAWAAAEPSWGIWNVPESELRLLPIDMRGMKAVELGCGTGYVSGWMARRHLVRPARVDPRSAPDPQTGRAPTLPRQSPSGGHVQPAGRQQGGA